MLLGWAARLVRAVVVPVLNAAQLADQQHKAEQIIKMKKEYFNVVLQPRRIYRLPRPTAETLIFQIVRMVQKNGHLSSPFNLNVLILRMFSRFSFSLYNCSMAGRIVFLQTVNLFTLIWEIWRHGVLCKMTCKFLTIVHR